MVNKRKKGNKMTLNNSKNIDDTILNGVLMVLDKNNIWVGTMTNLKSQLVVELGRKTRLPRSPSALRVVLNRVINRLRTRGVSVRFGRTNDRTRTRYVRFATR